MKENYIPIVMITDMNYVLPTAVSIYSLIKNKNKGTIYKIYILHNNLNEDIQNSFKKYNSKNVTIEFIEPENSSFLLSFKDNRKEDYVSAAVLFKFAIPKIFKDYEKILYLDGDTVIKGDLTELYNTDVREVYAGVVKDAHPIISKAYERFDIDTYFNAGVILYNISKILSDRMDDYLNSDKILNKTKEYMWYEQDTYNIVFNRNVKYLHPKYNFIVESWDKYGTKACSEVFDITEKEGKSLYKKAVIFHLASEQKPWIYKDGVMRKTWEAYYKSSPFSFMPIGNQIYFNAKKKDKFIEKIFSIKNSESKKHKIITIIGLKVKIKNRKQIKKEKFNISENKFDNHNNGTTELKELVRGK